MGSQAVSMPYLADTENVSSGERRDYWRHVVSHAFVPLEASFPREDAGFDGRLRGATLGALGVYDVDTGAHAAHRTAKLTTAAPAECYKLGLVVSGRGLLGQDGRQAVLNPGEFAVYDTDRPYTLTFEDPSRLLVLIFPRTMLGLPQDRIAQITATPISGDSGLGALVGPFLLQIGALLEEVETHGGARLAGNVIDLVATTLAGRLDLTADPGSIRNALFLRITSYIEAHLGDPGLGPAEIAGAHHISTRYLHKLFRAEGTTVLAWIRERRLDRCGRDLRDPLQLLRPVSAIAVRWGYTDASHFSRIFKAAFGLSPREYRHGQALCARGQDEASPLPRP
ncbi:helix-turn-helix domain-containing protein [Acrocarpospora macrocephala]|uniref:AraC family transcriptional regulator n=1 Tax=Acrocarpospora macrocephala TaxID=150177 RepID=A0A5M3WK79_9ACTN|nr:helix-turn-helix domain-containing protein [Acrocarpospora macrocephala]GES06808.1 AraC family transcriptional regulator [Acrocarpospora macrocephala]